jgi:hypothetical protein
MLWKEGSERLFRGCASSSAQVVDRIPQEASQVVDRILQEASWWINAGYIELLKCSVAQFQSRALSVI